MSEHTEYIPDTLRAAFSDPVRYVLPPGSMTLEPEVVVAGKFADAWEADITENHLKDERIAAYHKANLALEAEVAGLRTTLAAWKEYFDADLQPPGGPHDPDPAVAAYTRLQAALAALPPAGMETREGMTPVERLMADSAPEGEETK